jgi:acylphosphatase
LGITGYARNLSDGSVEVLARGAPEAVDELSKWLHHGPEGARVDGVAELDVGSQQPLTLEPPFEVG